MPARGPTTNHPLEIRERSELDDEGLAGIGPLDLAPSTEVTEFCDRVARLLGPRHGLVTRVVPIVMQPGAFGLAVALVEGKGTVAGVADHALCWLGRFSHVCSPLGRRSCRHRETVRR